MNRARAKNGFAVGLLLVGGLLSIATSRETPSIETVNPQPGTTCYPLGGVLEVQFKTPLERDTVNSDTVWLRNARSLERVEVSHSFGDGGKRLTVVPVLPLSRDTDYELVLDLLRIRDENGDDYEAMRVDETSQESMATSGQLAISFSTRCSLRVGRAYLAKESNELKVFFSQPVDTSTIVGANVSLLDPEGKVVPVDLRYAADLQRLRVLSFSELEQNGNYRLVLAGDIQSKDGTSLGDGAGDELLFTLEQTRIR